jgi:APA family basic amino acid/polyamine antiporter
LFIMAKTASAATAALGIGLYLGADSPFVPLAAVLLVTALVLAGMRRTTLVNSFLVTLTVAAIAWFTWNGVTASSMGNLPVLVKQPSEALLAATAFLFVAYTGYGRIATLGEEVKEPETIIPRAVIITLAIAALLYLGVEVGGRAMGGENWGAVLELGFLDMPFVTLGAITAMLGVLLNLVLGLSRVWLAMGRRGDMPRGLARLDRRSEPSRAIALSAVLVAALTLLGDIGLAWSFSAMTVLLYYGVTNLAALALDRGRLTGWLGLGSCVFLSFFVPLSIWLTGAGLLTLGLIWKTAHRRPT